MKFKKIGDHILSLVQSYLFWLLLLAFTFRNYFHNIANGIFYNADTASYCYAAQNIFHGLVDEYRTPVYPLFMRLIYLFNDMQYFENIITAQTIISFLSIIPFYLTCKLWFKNKPIAFLASLGYAIAPVLLRYNYSIYPESILISSLVVFIYLVSRYLVKPSLLNIILVNFFILFLTLIKPIGIYFYGVIGIFILLIFVQKNSKLKPKLFLISYIGSIILLAGYCGLNKNKMIILEFLRFPMIINFLKLY